MNNDLWSVFARLGRRKGLLALVLLLTAAAGAYGWVGTKPTYSASASQAVVFRPTESTGSQVSTGSYELGIVATMLTNNVPNSVKGVVPGATVAANNAVVTPAAALPLITMTSTAADADSARKALDVAKAANADMLNKLQAASGKAATMQVVEINPTSDVTASSQPKLRGAGSLAAGTLIGGLLLVLLLDLLLHRRHRVAAPTRPAATSRVVEEPVVHQTVVEPTRTAGAETHEHAVTRPIGQSGSSTQSQTDGAERVAPNRGE